MAASGSARRKTEMVSENEAPDGNSGKSGSLDALDALRDPLQFDSDRVDALDLQEMLRQHVEPGADKAKYTAPKLAKPAVPQSEPTRWKSRLMKSVLGLVLLVIAGWMPAQRLLQVSSVEAVVNARLVEIRAPISGVVSFGTSAIAVGETVDKGGNLASIENPRVDRVRIDNAEDRLDEARETRAALVQKRSGLEILSGDLSSRLEAFRNNRIQQISANIAETDARIASAIATKEYAETVRRRQASLRSNGIASAAAIGEAVRDAKVADAARAEAEAERTGLTVELEALKSGSYVGDSYNDLPRSAQQLEDVRSAISGLDAEISLYERRIQRYEGDLAREQKNFALAANADLPVPTDGRVWEVLTAPGEQVVTGQPLFKVLNCANPIVTAVVSEAVFNGLSVGQGASFMFREGGDPMPGHIAQLSGVAEASSNFAIKPSALTKESYRVSVALDQAPTSEGCIIGRTGRVVFDKPGV
jgi:multidrug resistance efflux pump